MENTSNHQFLKPYVPADDHRCQFELYTIPATAGWFSWDNIHEIEKTSLKEFFYGNSFTRNPRVYKEYRDFIISKYREDPSRRLTFSEARKWLVGDVNYLLKVFKFLEKSGLINFGVDSSVICDGEVVDDEMKWKVKVEDGPPYGVRVVSIPNSLKVVTIPDSVSLKNGCKMNGSDFKMPPLSSHSDVYQEWIELVCGNCKEQCEAGHYKYVKDVSSIICIKCYKAGSYGKNKSIEDYKFVDDSPHNANRAAAWTEAETLLLLESVLKHGDDWDLVAQTVKTKSKLDCISKLIQLAFGQLMLGPTYMICRKRDTIVKNHSRVKGGPLAPQVTKDNGSQHIDVERKSQQNDDADTDIEGPPPKRICIAPISDSSNSKVEQIDNGDEKVTPSLVVDEEIRENDSQIIEHKNQNQNQQDGNLEDHCPPKSDHSKPLPNIGNSLMQQVARISTVVGPHVVASAAEAAVTALCDENEIPKEIFDSEEKNVNESERIAQGNESEMETRPNESEKGVMPLPLRMSATSATALGAAAAQAKLLAMQEDIEVERLVSTILNTQLKKLQYKMELLREVEAIMENESTQMMEVEESLLTKRMDVVHKAIDIGLSRWRDHSIGKSQVEIIL
ncbi:SWI/SNF complex subunit SWI3A-like [Rutidosis leptorrhynchoides]|uniref:SWI/SNF complex subunit SWI3A-like n=1 Tax=Rutidosis leptorrhynchoides TaxID=125765 RepID=UPI003A9A45D1